MLKVTLALFALVQITTASVETLKLMNQLFETPITAAGASGEHKYNPNVIPVERHDYAIVVNHDLAIQQIINVDVKAEQLTILFWQRLEWYDHYLQWDPTEFDNLTSFSILPKYVWLPDIVVYNRVGSSTVQKDGLIPVSVSHDGLVQWNVPLILVTTCAIHIEHFPYDVQECDVQVGSWAHTAKQIVIKNKRNKMDTGYFTINGEWILGPTPAKTNYKTYGSESFTDVRYSMTIVRRALFYEKNLIIPTAMISMLASLTFLLPPESGEKIGLAITVFLALCVNLILVSEMMPATSLETPILGEYYLMAIGMVAISLLLTVIVLNFHSPHFNAPPPPQWLTKFMFKYIAPLVCLGRQAKHADDDSDVEIALNNNTNAGDDGIKLVHVSGTGQATESYTDSTAAINAKLDVLLKRFQEDEDSSKSVDEWQYLTRIIDRIFAVIFFLVTVVLTFVLIGRAKMEALAHAHGKY